MVYVVRAAIVIIVFRFFIVYYLFYLTLRIVLLFLEIVHIHMMLVHVQVWIDELCSLIRLLVLLSNIVGVLLVRSQVQLHCQSIPVDKSCILFSSIELVCPYLVLFPSNMEVLWLS